MSQPTWRFLSRVWFLWYPSVGPSKTGRPEAMALPIAILDVDGTLVDTNHQNALAWYRAFLRHDIVLPVWRIHRHIRMGGDQLVTALCGVEVERQNGDAIREDENELYMELIDEVRPFAAALRLIETLRED